MGLNIGANTLTSGALFLGTILLVVMGILLVSASNKVKQIPEFDQSSGLKKINDNLVTAYILAFVAAGIFFLVGAAYVGHETVWCPSEWWHGIFGTIALIILIISVIFAYLALNDLYNPELEDRNGSDLFIWASLIVSVFAFLLLGATGTGRVGYNVVSSDTSKRVNMAEKKIHEAHSAITGQPLEYNEPADRCAEPCDQGTQRTQGAQRAPKQQTYVISQPQVGAPTQVITRTPTQQLTVTDQPLGPPIVTRHSVVTTSQPMLSSPVMGNQLVADQQSVLNLSQRNLPRSDFF